MALLQASLTTPRLKWTMLMLIFSYFLNIFCLTTIYFVRDIIYELFANIFIVYYIIQVCLLRIHIIDLLLAAVENSIDAKVIQMKTAKLR